MDTLPLQQLLAQTALGDRAAFKQLYSASAPTLFGVAVRILGKHEHAEDVLQEAFVSIWKRADSYAPQASQPMTWMTAIVRNRCLDHLRSHGRHQTDSLDDEAGISADDIAVDQPSALALLERASESLQVRTCLETIEGTQRQSVALAFYQGMSHAEVAAHLQAPIGSVKAWIRRGLTRIKRCLEAGAA